MIEVVDTDTNKKPKEEKRKIYPLLQFKSLDCFSNPGTSDFLFISATYKRTLIEYEVRGLL